MDIYRPRGKAVYRCSVASIVANNSVCHHTYNYTTVVEIILVKFPT